MVESALSALDQERYISLATFRKSGVAVRTPVWFAASGDRLYVFSAAEAGKVKRLRANPSLRIAPCDVRGRVNGEWVEGRGRRVEDPAGVAAAYGALRHKYGWQMVMTNLLSRLTGRIHRRAVLEIELEPTAAS